MEQILLKVSEEEGSLRVYCLPNQTYTDSSSNKESVADTTVSVIMRDWNAPYLSDGNILFTNTLTYDSARVIYIAGSVTELVADKTGRYMGSTVNAAEAYKIFTGSEDEKTTTKFTAQKTTFRNQLIKDKRYLPPTVEDDGFFIDKEIWYFLVRSVSRKTNVMLIGDTGGGKSETVDWVCKKLGKPLEIFDMAISNPVTSLCGNQRINEKGVSAFQYARFAKRIQEGPMCLLDEISRAAPSANNVLLPVTDNRRTLYIENAMEDVEIKLHEDTVIWATANIGIRFSGTNRIDDALMNRFQLVELTYPPEDIEAKILEVRTNIPIAQAKNLVKFAKKIREDTDLSKKISTRQLIATGGLIHDGWPSAAAIELTILNQYEASQIDGSGERATIKSLIQSM